MIIRETRTEDIDEMVDLLAELFSIEKGRVIGMCSAQALISTAEGDKVCLVEDMVISKVYRGKDYGTKLLKDVEKNSTKRWIGPRQIFRVLEKTRRLVNCE